MSLDVSLCVTKTCPHCGQPTGETETVFDANITHNLNKMADEAGFYNELWHGVNVEFAKDLIQPLTKGLKKLKESPDYYKQFNAGNGWGLYEHFVPWLENLLAACQEYPDAVIAVSA